MGVSERDGMSGKEKKKKKTTEARDRNQNVHGWGIISASVLSLGHGCGEQP